jgi:hypothetical protein
VRWRTDRGLRCLRGVLLQGEVEPQVPPRQAGTGGAGGMTKFGVAFHLGMGGDGWTETLSTTFILSSKFRAAPLVFQASAASSSASSP